MKPTNFFEEAFLLNIAMFSFWVLLGYSKVLKNPVTSARVVVFLVAVGLIIVYPWQIVGLWRSCNRHVRRHGRHFWARTVQVLVVLGIIGNLGNINLFWPTYRSLFHMAFVKDEFSNYTAKLVKNGTLIHLDGNLGFGVSKEISKILKNNPQIKGIILDSMGGRVHEGRELAKLISANQLDTYSMDGCYSAATIAFIAGERRYLGLGANLAYHQYDLSYKGLDSFTNMKEEQDKDLLLFQRQGVKKEFLDKMFNATPDDLWYPTLEELLDSGVIHGIVNPSDLLPVDYSFSLEKFHTIMLDIPVYKTIQRYEPILYNKIVIELESQIKQGATLIEVQRVGADFLGPLAFSVLPNTSDEASLQFIQALIVSLKKLKDINPILCLKAVYPEQYGEVSLVKYLSDDETSLMFEAMDRAIIDAYEKAAPPIDVEAAELFMAKVFLGLEEYADYWELTDLRGEDDYRRHCDAIIKLYENILEADKAEAGNILRYMFSSE